VASSGAASQGIVTRTSSPLASSARQRRCEDRVDALVSDSSVALESANVGGDECLDTVAHACRNLSQWHRCSQPGGGRGVATVVDPQRIVADSPQRTLPRPCPVRCRGSAARAGAEEQIVPAEIPRVEPATQRENELGRYRHRPWPGLWAHLAGRKRCRPLAPRWSPNRSAEGPRSSLAASPPRTGEARRSTRPRSWPDTSGSPAGGSRSLRAPWPWSTDRAGRVRRRPCACAPPCAARVLGAPVARDQQAARRAPQLVGCRLARPSGSATQSTQRAVGRCHRRPAVGRRRPSGPGRAVRGEGTSAPATVRSGPPPERPHQDGVWRSGALEGRAVLPRRCRPPRAE
jgi:hypothetical protein